MRTVTFEYPNQGNYVVDFDDEGNIINQLWSTTMSNTDTTNGMVADPLEETYDAPEEATSLSAEQQLVQDYHLARETVAYCVDRISFYKDELRKAKAERSRLYKLASVIDPSLKQTRPKVEK